MTLTPHQKPDASSPQDLERQLRKLDVAPGDLLVLTCDTELDHEQVEALRSDLGRALPAGVRCLITPYDIDKIDVDEDVGPFDADELVRWADSYGHPEGWVKRAQAAHMRAERAVAELAALRSVAGAFTDLGEVGPVHFQGGVIWLQGHGCPGCGNGFWTEADDKRRLAPGAIHHCPHCGQCREVKR